jgi:hypothetical protein
VLTTTDYSLHRQFVKDQQRNSLLFTDPPLLLLDGETFHHRLYMYRSYVGYSESKERFAIKKKVLIIGKETNVQVVAHTFTNISM